MEGMGRDSSIAGVPLDDWLTWTDEDRMDHLIQLMDIYKEHSEWWYNQCLALVDGRIIRRRTQKVYE